MTPKPLSPEEKCICHCHDSGAFLQCSDCYSKHPELNKPISEQAGWEERFAKLKITYSNDFGVWKDNITDVLHEEAVNDLKDFIRKEKELSRKEGIAEAVKKIEDMEAFSDEHDQDVQTGIDIAWEQLQMLKSKLKGVK